MARSKSALEVLRKEPEVILMPAEESRIRLLDLSSNIRGDAPLERLITGAMRNAEGWDYVQAALEGQRASDRVAAAKIERTVCEIGSVSQNSGWAERFGLDVERADAPQLRAHLQQIKANLANIDEAIHLVKSIRTDPTLVENKKAAIISQINTLLPLETYERFDAARARRPDTVFKVLDKERQRLRNETIEIVNHERWAYRVADVAGYLFAELTPFGLASPRLVSSETIGLVQNNLSGISGIAKAYNLAVRSVGNIDAEVDEKTPDIVSAYSALTNNMKRPRTLRTASLVSDVAHSLAGNDYGEADKLLAGALKKARRRAHAAERERTRAYIARDTAGSRKLIDSAIESVQRGDCGAEVLRYVADATGRLIQVINPEHADTVKDSLLEKLTTAEHAVKVADGIRRDVADVATAARKVVVQKMYQGILDFMNGVNDAIAAVASPEDVAVANAIANNHAMDIGPAYRLLATATGGPKTPVMRRANRNAPAVDWEQAPLARAPPAAPLASVPSVMEVDTAISEMEWNGIRPTGNLASVLTRYREVKAAIVNGDNRKKAWLEGPQGDTMRKYLVENIGALTPAQPFPPARQTTQPLPAQGPVYDVRSGPAVITDHPSAMVPSVSPAYLSTPAERLQAAYSALRAIVPVPERKFGRKAIDPLADLERRVDGFESIVDPAEVKAAYDELSSEIAWQKRAIEIKKIQDDLAELQGKLGEVVLAPTYRKVVAPVLSLEAKDWVASREHEPEIDLILKNAPKVIDALSDVYNLHHREFDELAAFKMDVRDEAKRLNAKEGAALVGKSIKNSRVGKAIGTGIGYIIHCFRGEHEKKYTSPDRQQVKGKLPSELKGKPPAELKGSIHPAPYDYKAEGILPPDEDDVDRSIVYSSPTPPKGKPPAGWIAGGGLPADKTDLHPKVMKDHYFAGVPKEKLERNIRLVNGAELMTDLLERGKIKSFRDAMDHTYLPMLKKKRVNRGLFVGGTGLIDLAEGIAIFYMLNQILNPVVIHPSNPIDVKIPKPPKWLENFTSNYTVSQGNTSSLFDLDDAVTGSGVTFQLINGSVDIDLENRVTPNASAPLGMNAFTVLAKNPDGNVSKTFTYLVGNQPANWESVDVNLFTIIQKTNTKDGWKEGKLIVKNAYDPNNGVAGFNVTIERDGWVWNDYIPFDGSIVNFLNDTTAAYNASVNEKLILPSNAPDGRANWKVGLVDRFQSETDVTGTVMIPGNDAQYSKLEILTDNVSVNNPALKYRFYVSKNDGIPKDTIKVGFRDGAGNLVSNQDINLSKSAVKVDEETYMYEGIFTPAQIAKGIGSVSVLKGDKEVLNKSVPIKGKVPELIDLIPQYNKEWDFLQNKTCPISIGLNLVDDPNDITYLNVTRTGPKGNITLENLVAGNSFDDTINSPGVYQYFLTPFNKDDGQGLMKKITVVAAAKNHKFQWTETPGQINATVGRTERIYLPQGYDPDGDPISPANYSVKVDGAPTAIAFFDGVPCIDYMPKTEGSHEILFEVGDGKEWSDPLVIKVDAHPTTKINFLEAYTDANNRGYININASGGAGFSRLNVDIYDHNNALQKNLLVAQPKGDGDENLERNITEEFSNLAPGVYKVRARVEDINGANVSLEDKIIKMPSGQIVEDCPDLISTSVMDYINYWTSDMASHSNDWQYVMNKTVQCVRESLNAAGYPYRGNISKSALELIESVDYVASNVVPSSNRGDYTEILDTMKPTCLVSDNGNIYYELSFEKAGVKYILDFDWGVTTEQAWRSGGYKVITDEDHAGKTGAELHNLLWWILGNIGSRRAFLSGSIDTHPAPQMSEDYLDQVCSFSRNYTAGGKNNLLDHEGRIKRGLDIAGTSPIKIEYLGGQTRYDVENNVR